MVEELEAFLESKTLLRRLPTLAGGANVAARFSFLISGPVTAAAAGLSLAEAKGEGMGSHEALMFLAGSVSSGAVGYLAIRFLLRFLANHTLRIFAYYRFALAAVVALVLLSSGT
jgi:undecaprenyl-diphosphatase